MIPSVKIKKCLDMIEFLTKNMESDLCSLHYYPLTHPTRIAYLERLSATRRMLNSYIYELNELLDDYVQEDTL